MPRSCIPPWAGGIFGRRLFRSQPWPKSVHGTRVRALRAFCALCTLCTLCSLCSLCTLCTMYTRFLKIINTGHTNGPLGVTSWSDVQSTTFHHSACMEHSRDEKSLCIHHQRSFGTSQEEKQMCSLHVHASKCCVRNPGARIKTYQTENTCNFPHARPRILFNARNTMWRCSVVLVDSQNNIFKISHDPLQCLKRIGTLKERHMG